ncbi:hypothetical protein IEQ34_009814 [Dendrobium chrysotoxum]|uniref:Uncharacterized protein n=1 Tax=Dendrobium chrysotoxum TaxID=161865 RepID=A0AAV7GKC4_DENCH|nr:hypothetical protein IEQ34_009814 [Dendrobium chrysotoxum]
MINQRKLKSKESNGAGIRGVQGREDQEDEDQFLLTTLVPPDVDVSRVDVQKASKSWGLTLVGYSLGITIAVDSLIVEQLRLTFARVCVLIKNDSTLPDEINVSIAGGSIKT